MVDQGGTTAVERLESGGLIIGGTRLPTPAEDTEPLAGQRAHGGLMRLPCVTLRLVIDPRPESIPDRFGGPLDAGLPEALGTREAPVPPGLLAAAGGARSAPGIFWQGGGARAGALFAQGDAQPGGQDGAGSCERLEQGAIRLALRTLRAGMIKGRHRLPGASEWGDKGRDKPGMGRANARIGGQGEGRLEGVVARCADVR
jgi:hypothetical protein